jgi:hypothetical protein
MSVQSTDSSREAQEAIKGGFGGFLENKGEEDGHFQKVVL